MSLRTATTTTAPDLHVLSDDDPAITFDGLREAGYLLLAVPVELGGLGGNLAQVCDQQRRLARRVPDLAMALTAHLAWCGAASERRRSGGPSLGWVLDRALAGEVVSSVGRRCDPVQEPGVRACPSPSASVWPIGGRPNCRSNSGGLAPGMCTTPGFQRPR